MLITMETQLDDATVEDFLAIYRESFSVLDDQAAARQSLNDDEFRNEMDDESVLKFVAWSREQRPVALAFVATDLSVVPWISEPYWAARFPEHHARGVIFYFGALLVRPEHRGGSVSYELLKELSRFVAIHDGIAAFDCSQFNIDTIALPDLIAQVAREVCHVETHQVDVQLYYAYVASQVGTEVSRELPPSIQSVRTQRPMEGEPFIDLVALEAAERVANEMGEQPADSELGEVRATNGGDS